MENFLQPAFWTAFGGVVTGLAVAIFNFILSKKKQDITADEYLSKKQKDWIDRLEANHNKIQDEMEKKQEERINLLVRITKLEAQEAQLVNALRTTTQELQKQQTYAAKLEKRLKEDHI